MENSNSNYDAIVIGSGFGGMIMALTIAREFYLENLDDNGKPKGNPRKVLILERGTWWTTPVGTVADKEVAAYEFLKKNNQPVQFWSSNNSFRGFVDLLTRCTHHEGNVDGLYELTRFGTAGLLGIFGKNDGVTVLRASGVGGGSLVYSNITVQPPSLVFNDSRWDAMQNWKEKKGEYYDAARSAIGTGILTALKMWDDKHEKPRNYSEAQLKAISSDPLLQPRVNTGLSQIVTRSTQQNPHWKKLKVNGTWEIIKNNEDMPLYQIDKERESKKLLDITAAQILDPSLQDDKRDLHNDLWVDRARIFQNGMEKLSKQMKVEYSANDLSINDFNTLPLQIPVKDDKGNDVHAGDNQFDHTDTKAGNAKNHCERQGRCNVGCLPGARHTLNKQLMNALYGSIDYKRDSENTLIKDSSGNFVLPDLKGIFDGILEIRTLCEVDYIKKLDDNDYEIHFWQHNENSKRMWKKREKQVLRTKKTVVSAGCLGTNEIMLRSKKKNGINNLSDKLGEGFSTNGDNFYLLGQTKERVRSIRGPAQTSHAHFNLDDPGNTKTNESTKNVFHMIEDLGIPPSLATTVGFGQQVFNAIASGKHKLISTIIAVTYFLFKKLYESITAIFKNNIIRQDVFKNEDEVSSNYLIVTTTGREQSKAKIKLGGIFQTPLRMERKKADKKTDDPFIDDPVYTNIEATLNPDKSNPLKPNMAKILADENAINANDKIFIRPGGNTVACSHPLGGCPIGMNDRDGVVDEFGHVFDTSKTGDPKPFHEGLYIADGSIIPSALGVNPSLSISAVCWHVANNIRKEL